MTLLYDVAVYEALGHNKFTKFTKMKNLSSMISIYEHDQILIYEHKCQQCSPTEFLPKKTDVCVIDTFRLLVLNYYYNYNYYYYCTTLFCKAHNISNRHKSNVPRWQQ